ncbi:unnamed protein product [Anisakis simplex]|uniref:Transforming acidic coiled-coil protein (inferred by orthology to a D. melanogaster protein) n=1 Tax=Anisakis simplex TaxID=6269 RepID=A0A0M3J1P2_ANISI|nr:unnamed protein product [Anisakis simplex]
MNHSRIDSRTITRPSKKGQALPEATVAPVAKVDSQPQTTAATQMAAAAADIPTVPPVQHLQQKPQQPQSKAVPVASQGVPVVSAVTSSSASSAAATVSATAEPQPSVPPSTAHPTQPTPKAPAQPQQQSQQQRPQVHQQPPQQQQQQSQVVTAAPVKTSSAPPHGDANAVAAVKAVEQAKKEDPRSSSHRVRQRTVTVHSQFAIDVATAFHEIKQMGLDDPLTEAQRRIQAVIAMKEKEWAARFEKMGQVLAHEQKKSDVLEQKASERLLLVGEQEACIKKLVEQLKRISQKGSFVYSMNKFTLHSSTQP